jgi:hypothetical protein
MSINELKCDPLQSLAFLKMFRPDGDRQLTAINPETKKIQTRTFRSTQIDEMCRWIDVRNTAGDNIYFSVAETMTPLNKKAKRTDIKGVSYLHVDNDVDYKNGQTVDEAIEKAIERLSSGCNDIPQPTFTNLSGGGVQAFWLLKKSIPIDGDVALADAAARYNQRLAKSLRGDNCHSVEHLMRLPGTINWPDKKKRDRGRVPVLATLYEWNTERVYDISAFPKLEPEEKSQKQTNPAATEFVVPKNVERLKDISDLDEWHVPGRIKKIIDHGRHPNEEPKENDDSRSAWLFDAVCDLVRCNVPTNVIFAIITDPAYKISESVLDSSDPENYAKRQIEQATAKVVDPVLKEMNARHAVIQNYGGKCVVTEELYDPQLNRHVLMPQTFDHFRNGYLNRKIQVGSYGNGNPKFVRLGKWWLEHPNRRTYKKVVFAPNQDIPDAYNLWKGFAVEAVAGDWSLFRDHILQVVCGGDDDCFQYLIQWMARCVQEPEGSGQVAIVLRGGKGCGKSIFVETFGRIFGQHYLMTTNAEHIAGHFNEHLQTVVVLFGDEAFFAGNKDHERTLKGLVTQDELSFEGKGRPVTVGRNYVHLLLASNSTWVVPAHGKERRYVVLDVSEQKTGDRDYFSAIAKQMKSGGSEAMLHDLLHMDLKGFEVRDFPQTAALQEQQQESAEFEESAMVEILTNGFTPDCERYSCQPNELSGIGLLEFARELGFVGRSEEKHSNLTRLGHFVKKLARLDSDEKPVSHRRHRDNGGTGSRVRVYELRPLQELRKEFDYLVGPEGWGDSHSEWTSASSGRPDSPDLPF